MEDGTPKYIVFKWEDWYRFEGQAASEEANTGPYNFRVLSQVPDALVIRRQDIIAGPALHAYAAAVRTYVEGLNYGVSIARERDQAGINNVRDTLHNLADVFHEAAIEADHANYKKVPD